jgi:hypothetical protein
MAPSGLIVVVFVAGYIVALPVMIWGLGDIAKIPGGVWRHAAERPRHQWRIGIIATYVLGGWPTIVAVYVWRRSRERADLLYEWADLSERKRNSRRRGLTPRAAAEPVILLADYDAAASRESRHTDA